MIQILEFKNVFGIDDLENCNLISGNALIYSPNGTMKSSFADAIKCLSTGADPSDVERPLSSYIKIKNNDGNDQDDFSSSFINSLVLKGEDSIQDLKTLFDEDKDFLTTIALSDKARTDYLDFCAKKKALGQEFYDCVASLFCKKKSEKPDKIFKSLTDGNQSDPFLALSLLSEDDFEKSSSISLPFDDVDIGKIGSAPAYNAATKEEFTKKIDDFSNIINKKFSEPGIYTDSFSVNELDNLNKSAQDNHFYDAGHFLSINGKTLGKDEVNALIKKTTDEIYGGDDVKAEITEIKKSLSAKNVQPLNQLIDARKDLVPFLHKYQQFCHIAFIKKFDNDVLLHKLMIKVDELMAFSKSIAKESQSESSAWDDAVNVFNYRFCSNGFSVKKTNVGVFEGTSISKIGINIVKNDGGDVSESLCNRFSKGEKDSLRILKWIFEIEKKKQEGKEFLLVLDDIADSFDFKNKLAIVAYINDLLEESEKNKKIQIIVLTHSFDFYRNLLPAFRKEDCNRLLAYKKQLSTIGGTVEVSQISDSDYSGIVYTNSWKNRPDYKYAFSYLPILRNIVQLSEGTSKITITQIDSFFHWTNNTAQETFTDLYNVCSKTDFCKVFNNGTKNYDDAAFFSKDNLANFGGTPIFSLLKDCVTKMSKSDIEKHLENKIIAALFIRLSSERFFVNSLMKENIQLPPTTNMDNYGQSLFINAMALTSIDAKIKKELRDARILGNSFVHFNSFLDTPLIDYGPERVFDLKELALNDWALIKQ